MGLEQNSSGKTFLSIADGSIVRRYKEANERTKQRITKTGKVVHEEHFSTLSGLIDGFGKREHEYGVDFEITVKDGEQVYQLSMPFSSRYASSFMKALPNVDLTKEVKLRPWSLKDGEKTITGITLYQPDKIAPFYTKEAPNGLPEMVQVKVKGKITYDDDAMMSFLFAKSIQQLAESKVPF
jgi:hypothetical protein